MIILGFGLVGMVIYGFDLVYTPPPPVPQYSIVELLAFGFGFIILFIVFVYLIIAGWNWYGSFLGGSKSKAEIRREL